MIHNFPENIKAFPFHFYFDNLFTGIPVLYYLKQIGYDATGTIRENRIPGQLVKKDKAKIKKKTDVPT